MKKLKDSEEIGKLDPERIIIVKKSILPVVREALEKAGFGNKILNEKAIRW